MQTLLEKFEARFIPEPMSGCWIWTAGCNGDGYGCIYDLDGRACSAHRVAWELFSGPIPEGIEVLHHCDNRPCVNWQHLFLGTQLDNIVDMVSKGRQRSNGQKISMTRRAKTHCKRGHELSGYNLITAKDGHRNCRTCWKMLQAKYRANKAA
jgi:hypothetical protein